MFIFVVRDVTLNWDGEELLKSDGKIWHSQGRGYLQLQ